MFFGIKLSSTSDKGSSEDFDIVSKLLPESKEKVRLYFFTLETKLSASDFTATAVESTLNVNSSIFSDLKK
jgi:hypothetical protein